MCRVKTDMMLRLGLRSNLHLVMLFPFCGSRSRDSPCALAWSNTPKHARDKAPATLAFVVRHSRSAASACRCAMMSLLLKWSGHAGPRPMHSSVRPPHVLWSLSHRSPARRREHLISEIEKVTESHNVNSLFFYFL